MASSKSMKGQAPERKLHEGKDVIWFIAIPLVLKTESGTQYVLSKPLLIEQTKEVFVMRERPLGLR